MSEFYNTTIPCNTVLQGEKNTWRSGKGKRKSSLGLQTEEITHWRKEPFSTPICQKSSVSYFFVKLYATLKWLSQKIWSIAGMVMFCTQNRLVSAPRFWLKRMNVQLHLFRPEKEKHIKLPWWIFVPQKSSWKVKLALQFLCFWSSRWSGLRKCLFGIKSYFWKRVTIFLCWENCLTFDISQPQLLNP